MKSFISTKDIEEESIPDQYYNAEDQYVIDEKGRVWVSNDNFDKLERTTVFEANKWGVPIFTAKEIQFNPSRVKEDIEISDCDEAWLIHKDRVYELDLDTLNRNGRIMPIEDFLEEKVKT